MHGAITPYRAQDIVSTSVIIARNVGFARGTRNKISDADSARRQAFSPPLDERQCEQTPLPHAAFSAILGDAERRKGDGGHASGIRHADGGLGAQERAYAGA